MDSIDRTRLHEWEKGRIEEDRKVSYTSDLGKLSSFLKRFERHCADQGVMYFDELLDFLGAHHGPRERDQLLREMVRVLIDGSFRTLYELHVNLGLVLRVIAPLPSLKITFQEVAVLASLDHEYWRMFEPGNREAFDVLRRELIPYRLVYLQNPTEDGKYHTWRPDRNLGGLVDGSEHFGPQDVIVLVD